jgi:aspartate aminotransferase
VLAQDALREQWQAELLAMCRRINELRARLRRQLEATTGGDFGFIDREKGMFSFLGLSPAQARRLREEHSVYMLDSSRINVAGVNAGNIDYLARAVAAVF